MRVLIIGAGEVGYNIAARLAQEGNDVYVIEKNFRRVTEVGDHLDVQVICGSGSDPQVLETAGLGKAEMLIAVTASDEVNVIACLLARAAGSSAIKVARIRDPHLARNEPLFGKGLLDVDLIIDPEGLCADKILSMFDFPGAEDIIHFAENRVHLVALRLKPTCSMVGKRLALLAKEEDEHFGLIAAIVRGRKMVIPRGDDELRADDLLYVVVADEGLGGFVRKLGYSKAPLRRVMILGESNIALSLARACDRAPYTVKVVVSNGEKAEEFASQLNRAIVLCEKSTDKREILVEENIHAVDAFVAATDDDEVNVLTALLARKLGARHVFVTTNQPAYVPLMGDLGAGAIIAPRMAAVSSILHFVRKGRVIAASSFHGDNAEALEIQAEEGARFVGKPLMKLRFPKGAIIGALVRGEEIIIPKGKDEILPGDRVIVFAKRTAIKEVERVVRVAR